MKENVLCFKRSMLDQIGKFQGVNIDVDRYLPTVFGNALFSAREGIEENYDFKQIIPYVIVVCDDYILRYRRGGTDGESRLHGLYSIGVGGHISRKDKRKETRLQSAYDNGLKRELTEELGPESFLCSRPVALINDDSTKVGEVHLGVVHVLRVSSHKIAKACSLNSPEFVHIRELRKEEVEYEMWSKYCLEELDLLLCQHATLGPHDHPVKIPIRLIRPGDLPGFFLCETYTGEPILVHRQQLV